jgi:hypothetical protein
MPDLSLRAGGDIRFRTVDGAAILGLDRPAKRNAVSHELARFLDALRAADMPTLGAIREFIRQAADRKGAQWPT